MMENHVVFVAGLNRRSFVKSTCLIRVIELTAVVELTLTLIITGCTTNKIVSLDLPHPRKLNLPAKLTMIRHVARRREVL